MTTDNALDLYQASRGELATAGDLANWQTAAQDWAKNCLLYTSDAADE